MSSAEPGPDPQPGDRILPPREAVIAAESGGGTPRPAAAADRIRRGSPAFRRILLAMFAAGFVTFGLLYCVQPLMPVLAREFSLQAAGSSLVLSLSTGLLAACLAVTGPASDALGRKPIMVLALFGAALGTIGSAVMPTWDGVLVMRALIGISLSGLVAVAMTYLSEEIHPEVLGWSMGLYIGGNAVGGMCGRLIAGVMVDFVSWRIALGTLGLVGLVVALIFTRAAPPSRNFQPTPMRLSSLREGFVLHLRDPGLPWLFAEGFLLMGGFVTLFNYIGYRLLAPPYHLSQAIVGSASAVYLTGIYSSPRVGLLADKLGRRRVLWAITAVMLAGALITLARPLWVILIGMLVFSFGFFGAHSVASSWIGRRARRARGQASSLYLICYYLGGSIAGTLGGYFWHSSGWTGVALFISALLALAVLIALKLTRLPPLPAA